MLNNPEIIEKLTVEQKLRLIADVSSLGQEDFSELDLRCISETSMQECNISEGNKFPAFSGMVNSWNKELLAAVSDSLAKSAKEAGATLLNIPSANVKTAPYSAGYSEDPYLLGNLVGAAAGAGNRCGIKTCVSDPSITQLDAEYSDVAFNNRAVYEYFKKPFEIVFKHGVSAISTTTPQVSGAYQSVNAEWLEKLTRMYPVIYKCRSAKETMPLFLEGKKFCKGGAYEILQEALEKYAQLRESFESGGVTLNEIEAECECGNAVSPQMIDDAVDRILDFTLACQRTRAKERASAEDEKLPLKAAEESIVLLKNTDKLLPIKRKKRIAVIGDHARVGAEGVTSIARCAAALGSANRIKYVGFARGYDMETDRCDGLIEEAKKLAAKADIVVLVLGHNEQGRKRMQKNGTAKLPASQLALVEALSRIQTKLVAVVCGDVYPDMRFDEACDGVLLAPISGAKSADALFNVLTGATCPSGKLAASCYNDTDTHFETLRNYKNAGRNKVGTFYGYRHYDSAGLAVKYPFGYGLSYTKFKYSKIKQTGEFFSLTVKNVGKCAGAEVVQIYVGKNASSIIRPKKELKAFFKVFLRKGQSKTLTFSVKDLDLNVWDEKQKKAVCESGYYQIYACSSVKEVQSRGQFLYGTARLEKTNEKYSDYLQTHTNIHHGGYYLEVPARPTKLKAGFRRFAIGWSLVTLCLDAVFLYFNYIRWVPKHWSIYAAVGILNAIPIGLSALLISANKNKIKKDKEKSMKEKQKKRATLNAEDLAEEIPYEELFETEFSSILQTQEEETAEEYVREKTVVEVPFNRELPITRVCEEFATFAYERGVSLDVPSVRKLFSAFAASRLLVVKANDNDLLSKLLPIMSEYFGTSLSVDSYQGDVNEDSLLYTKDEFGESMLSNAGRAIIAEGEIENRMRIISLTDVKCEGLKACLAPIIRYVDQPLRETEISVKTKASEFAETYELPESMWFILALSDGERLIDIPKYILDMASVVDLLLKEGEKPKTRMVMRKKAAPVAEEDVPAVTAEEEGAPSVAAEEESTLTAAPTAEEDGVTPVALAEEEIPVEEFPVEEPPIEEFPVEENEEPDGEMEYVEEIIETEKTPVEQLVYSQFKKLAEYAGRDYQLDELLWKRIDKLETFVNSCNEYRIENKQWQRMEKFAAVYLAAGGEAEEALDCVLAQQLVYGMLPCIVNSKKPLEDKFVDTVENIFGEGHVPCSVKAVKETGLGI